MWYYTEEKQGKASINGLEEKYKINVYILKSSIHVNKPRLKLYMRKKKVFVLSMVQMGKLAATETQLMPEDVKINWN